jgi:flagellar operon protein
MLLNDFLKMRGQQISVNKPTAQDPQALPNKPELNEKGQTFADALREKLGKNSDVEFSNHAIRRLDSRSVDIEENGKLERLNEGTRIAAEKGSNDALILVDSTAFLVSVKNNKVVTTMELEELKGNVFTNIDSTVIM